jgi:ribosome maturation factor RimP
LFLGKAMYREIPAELLEVIEPIVESHGLELVDVEAAGAGGHRVLRITVDTPLGDGQVPVDRCAEVSREVGTHLDAHDLLGGSYLLEVSSPGLDRHLARDKDFARAVGRVVRLETRRPQDGRRRFRGRLVGFEGGIARVEVDGREVAIAVADVARAHAVYEFTSADFVRAGGARR